MFTITIRPVHNASFKPVVLHARTKLGTFLQLCRVTFVAAGVYDSLYGKVRYEDSPKDSEARLLVGGGVVFLEITVDRTPQSPDEAMEPSGA
jgi:hypothetical protein